MAIRARLTPPREIQTNWPWHKVKSSSLRASLLADGERRMEAENFLASGFGTRLAIESKAAGWTRLVDVAPDLAAVSPEGHPGEPRVRDALPRSDPSLRRPAYPEKVAVAEPHQ